MVESSRELGPWRERVALAAHHALGGAAPFVGAVALEFVLPRPKATPKRRTPHAIKRPDLDKVTRAILDAVTGVLLLDDAQVVDLHAHKRLAGIGETPGVTVTLEETEKGNTQ